MFTENSVIVKVWASEVFAKRKELRDVPNLSNLIAVVTTVVASMEGGEINV